MEYNVYSIKEQPDGTWSVYSNGVPIFAGLAKVAAVEMGRKFQKEAISNAIGEDSE